MHFWIDRVELPKWEKEFLEDVEWQRKCFNDRYIHDDEFYVDDISKSLLGHGYSEYTLPSDGCCSLRDAVVALENGDIVGGKVWVWYNK